MKRLFRMSLRFLVLPVLLLLGSVTGGVDGLVGWLVLGWMLWRGGPQMWRDVRTVVRWFFGFRARGFGLRRRRSAVSDLNV